MLAWATGTSVSATSVCIFSSPWEHQAGSARQQVVSLVGCPFFVCSNAVDSKDEGPKENGDCHHIKPIRETSRVYTPSMLCDGRELVE